MSRRASQRCKLSCNLVDMGRTRLTIDANCVINLFDRESTSATSVEELQTLVRYALDGKAEIAVTTRLEADLERDKVEERRSALIGMLEMFPVISSIMRWDVSRWDKDLWADDASERLNDEIQKILSPGLTPQDKRFSNKINDIDHLTGHVIDKRDIFVTDDTGIVRKRDQLRDLGIVVMTPAQCVEYLDGIELRSRPRTLPSDSYPPEYHSRGLVGTVTFDYTNNNKRFAIGEGQHLSGRNGRRRATCRSILIRTSQASTR